MPLTSKDQQALRDIAQRLRQNPQPKRILFITGAGLSADSGLPTYRGIGGLYDQDNTEDGISIEDALSGPMLKRNPALTWKYIHEIEAACRHGQPNAGHTVIADMEQDASFDVVVLTQNVDGFHRVAGSQQVIDIHGDIHKLCCTECSWKKTLPDYTSLGSDQPPLCPTCHSVIRPEVVLFQEMLPRDKLRKLEDEMEKGFDVVFSIGTTSSFSYIAQPVIFAKQQGGLTIEINPGTTRLSSSVDHKISAGAAETLTALQKLLRPDRN